MKSITPLLLILAIAACSIQPSKPLTSANNRLHVKVFITSDDTLAYTIEHDGRPVVLESDLGLELAGADFTRDLSIVERSPVRRIVDDYILRGAKQRHITYRANERTFSIINADEQTLSLTFRVSDDGVAFRYAVRGPDGGEKQFIRETTSFQLPKGSRAWLQPMAQAQTGWSNTNPSYEEHYQRNIPVGQPSTLGAGWVFPALFKTGQDYVLLSEAGLDGSWHASRLHHASPGGEYRLDTPQPPEVFTDGELLARGEEELVSPWRIIAVGSLATLMESTLGTDLAEPAVVDPEADFIAPGHASWSWAILKDEATTFDVQKQFVDYAADMHWDYTLVDANWDQQIGYDRLEALVDYAAEKGIGILVWLNSAGDWNTTPQTPKNTLLTPEQRTAIFSRLHGLGVQGVKIDFFAGDGRSMIAYYEAILRDAAQHKLLVNFHGTTLPRGWQRTYPHLVTSEAIKGFEYGSFSQDDQDQIATQAVMSLFTRNVFDPMDFTPMIFGDLPNIERRTDNSFELAQSVLMVSGIQHFAAIPQGMETVPEYVKAFLRDLPREWDEVKFLGGEPGRYIALARRAGNTWYVAGLNAEDETRQMTLNLSFAGDKQGILIEGGDTARSFATRQVDSNAALDVEMKTKAGFVLVLR